MANVVGKQQQDRVWELAEVGDCIQLRCSDGSGDMRRVLSIVGGKLVRYRGIGPDQADPPLELDEDGRIVIIGA